MSTKLHVGNISSAVLEDDLKVIFSQFGSVEAVEIARDPVTGINRGFAIVAMSRDEDASAAIARLKKAAPKAEAAGVVLGVESYLNADEHLRILDAVDSPAVKVYYDVANMNKMGYDVYKDRVGERRIPVMVLTPVAETEGEGESRV